MCAILDSSVIHCIANFLVCVDLIVLPSGRFIIKGPIAGEILVTGVPGSTKWPVEPVSGIFMSNAILIFDLLNIVSA